MKKKEKLAIAGMVLGLALCLANVSEVKAGTTDMYETVKEAVESTYTEDSYEFAFVGEGNEVTREGVENVIEEITEDYSSLYEIDMKNIMVLFI